jgi:hypothetical protein
MGVIAVIGAGLILAQSWHSSAQEQGRFGEISETPDDAPDAVW